MNKSHFKELCKLLTKIRTEKEARKVLKDILTPREIAALTQRLQIIKLLAKGIPHRKISRKLRVSIAKVTRGSRALRRNHGGFPLLLRHL